MSIADKIKHIVADILEVDFENITDEAQFKAISTDSLDLVRVVMEIEDQFDIEIPDEHIDRFKTIKDFIDYVREFQ
jgi:acyl carrier protein